MHFQLSVESAFASCSVILEFSRPDNIGSRSTGVSKLFDMGILSAVTVYLRAITRGEIGHVGHLRI